MRCPRPAVKLRLSVILFPVSVGGGGGGEKQRKDKRNNKENDKGKIRSHGGAAPPSSASTPAGSYSPVVTPLKISKHGRALDYHDAHNGRQVYSRMREEVHD